VNAAPIGPTAAVRYPAVRPAPPESNLLFAPVHLAVTVAIVLACVVLLSSDVVAPDSTFAAAAVGCGLVVLALIAYLRIVVGLPWLSASIGYLTLFWMFHYGLAFTSIVLPGTVRNFEPWEINWMYGPNVRVAMVLAVIGAAGFVGGVGMMVHRTPGTRTRPDPREDVVLFRAGWALLVLGLAGSAFFIFQAGGLGVFSLGYLDFRSTVLAETQLQSAIDLSQLGCLFALCGADRHQWRWPLAAWSVLGALLLLIGMRTEALIPLVAYIVVLSHRGVRFRRRHLVASVLAIAVMIPAVKGFRNVGFGNRSDVDWTDVTPLDTLTELGGTLRATKAYVDWIESGDSFLLGTGYWAPFDRHMLSRLVPGWEQRPYETDERIPTRNMVGREGSVGTSATGESYYNFGVIGPFVFYLCVGLLFGVLERKASESRYLAALLGITMFLFYFNIRGSWLPVPIRFTLAAALLAACRSIAMPAVPRLVHARRDPVPSDDRARSVS
jgi:oligosaccharide repeat unit polymerase